MDLNNLTEVERIILNSILIGGIAFFSSLTITGLPTMGNVWAAFVGASLAGITQLLPLTKIDTSEDCKKKPPRLGMLI